jgi:hypothetical protein
MAIPTDYIFTPGTCLKKDFYGVLCAALIGAGWTNVTSNSTTDGDVFVSTGNTGDKSLIINLNKNQASPSTDVTTTIFSTMTCRFPISYTPGAAGVAGTFVRPGTLIHLSLAPIHHSRGMSLDTLCYYKLYVDKNKVMFSIEYPPAASDTTGVNWVGAPIFNFVGLPDTLYTSEPGNRGMVMCSTFANTSAGTQGGAVNALLVANNPSNIGNSADVYAMPLVYTNIPTNPNNSGVYALTELEYGSTVEGVRGKLDGVYMLPSANVRTGMQFNVESGEGTHTYYVINANGAGYSAGIPSKVVAIRIT